MWDNFFLRDRKRPAGSALVGRIAKMKGQRSHWIGVRVAIPQDEGLTKRKSGQKTQEKGQREGWISVSS